MTYTITLWQTKYDREEGFAICGGLFTDLAIAEATAEDYFDYCESVEIWDENDNLIKGYYPED